MRQPRFRLRTLMIVVAIAGLGSATVSRVYRATLDDWLWWGEITMGTVLVAVPLLVALAVWLAFTVWGPAPPD